MYWTISIFSNSNNRSLVSIMRDKKINSLLLRMITSTKHSKNIISRNKLSITMVINLQVKSYKLTKIIKRLKSHHRVKYTLPKMYLGQHWLNLLLIKSHFHKHFNHWQQITNCHQNYKKSHDNKYSTKFTK